MNETELLRELSRRTSLPEKTATAVIDALRDLVHEGAVDQKLVTTLSSAQPLAVVDEAAQPATADPEPVANPTAPHLVESLIARAKKHPLGIEFLVSGFLASVAVALGAHAFTVVAARERLRKEQQNALNKADEPKETEIP